MRISDWSSDVCSSDLHAETRLHPEPRTLGVAQESDGGTDRAEVRRHRASERGARAGAPLRVHFRLAEQMDGAFAQRLVERGGDRDARDRLRRYHPGRLMVVPAALDLYPPGVRLIGGPPRAPILGALTPFPRFPVSSQGGPA